MTQLKGRTLIGIGIFLALALFVRTQAGQADRGEERGEGRFFHADNVNVVNPHTKPVPVQGVEKEFVRLAVAQLPADQINPVERDVFRVFPDGTTDTIAFQVPAGKELVVTDMNGFFDAPPEYAAGLTGAVQMQIKNLANPTIRVLGPALSVPMGKVNENLEFGAASLSLHTGFVVSDKVKLTLLINTPGIGKNLDNAVLTGYLRPAQ